MTQRSGIFAGDDPFELARAWLAEAEASELNDPNAMALATADADGLPNVRMVLLKDIEKDAFVFYTNYESAKGRELEVNPQAALVLHWKTLGRQIRVRGTVERQAEEVSDAYYASRSLTSRIGAWASRQSQPLRSREALMQEVAQQGVQHGPHPRRPSFWGGFRILPKTIEFWADGDFRLHDRFQWVKTDQIDDMPPNKWAIDRLNP